MLNPKLYLSWYHRLPGISIELVSLIAVAVLPETIINTKFQVLFINAEVGLNNLS